MGDTISRRAAIEALGEKPLAWTEGEYELGLQNQWELDVDAIKGLPPAQPEQKGYTKAEYIMALHKEYGVDFARAEEAHNRALEYLRSTAMMKG